MLCTRKLEFDAGHRVLGHGGKCRHLHGHRYVAEVTCYAEELDKLGFVVDFSVIKTVVGDWIDENFDHNMILNPKDPLWTVWQEVIMADPAKQMEDVFAKRLPFI